VIRSSEQKIVFLGCALDCDEKHDAIQEKLSGNLRDIPYDDPLVPFLEELKDRLPDARWEEGGSIDVPGWLRPVPREGEYPRVVVDEFVRFMDEDGCRNYADRVRDRVARDILPGLPVMVSPDHALTGGVYRALGEHYGKENISLIIVDSHTDAVPMSKMAEAILYDIDTNPGSYYDRSDPFLYNRAESYNASSFIHHLLAEGVVEARDLFIIGVSDYPEKKTLRIKDPRVANYCSVFTGLKRQGATVISKKDCQQKPTKVKNLLKKIRTPYAYLSVDMDIGARNALEGVRFRNWQGLSEQQIYRLIDHIHAAGGDDLQVVGMDLTEINSRTAGQMLEKGEDRTYRIAVNIAGRILYNQTESG